jgi:8-oxo-dGTP pyrophosphatase MutT (NUDIX family)
MEQDFSAELMNLFSNLNLVSRINEAFTPIPTGVGGLLLSANQQVCSISRKYDKADFGLPGGKVDPGESEVDALKRELFEELGITPTEFQRVFGVVDSKGTWFITFLVKQWEGTPYDKEEQGAIVSWLPPSRLIQPTCSFADYNRALFNHLGILSV